MISLIVSSNTHRLWGIFVTFRAQEAVTSIPSTISLCKHSAITIQSSYFTLCVKKWDCHGVSDDKSSQFIWLLKIQEVESVSFFSFILLIDVFMYSFYLWRSYFKTSFVVVLWPFWSLTYKVLPISINSYQWWGDFVTFIVLGGKSPKEND